MSDSERGRRDLVAVLLVVLPVLVSIPAGVVITFLPAGNKPLWIGLLVALTLVLIAVAIRSQRQDRQVSPTARWLVPLPPPRWVDRAELAKVVSAVTAADGAPVALTTGLAGAGGFGKTTLRPKRAMTRACGGGSRPGCGSRWAGIWTVPRWPRG